MLLEPANDPPCASYLKFSREHGMTSSRIEPVLKRRLSGNIAQTRHPYLSASHQLRAHVRYSRQDGCYRSDPHEVEGYSTFSGGLAACLTGLPYHFRESEARPTRLYRAENFRKDGSADI